MFNVFAGMLPERAVATMREYKRVSLQNLLDKSWKGPEGSVASAPTEKCILLGVLLSIRKNKTLTVVRHTSTSSKRSRPEKSYDRCLILGEPGSSKCFVLILSGQDTERVLELSSQISIGQPVVIVEPRFEDLYLSNTHNPIISTTSWLLPAVINNMPPTPIIRVANTGSFNFFVLREVELSLGYCTWEKGCSGDLCDGQCVDASTCPSISRPRKAAYIAGALVHCVEFPGTTTSRRTAPFRGVTLTSLLTKESIWQTDVPPTAMELRQAAKRITNLVNNNGGWKVMGWNKAGQSMEETSGGLLQASGTYKEIENVHIVAIVPERIDSIAELLEAMKMSPAEVEDLDWEIGRFTGNLGNTGGIVNRRTAPLNITPAAAGTRRPNTTEVDGVARRSGEQHRRVDIADFIGPATKNITQKAAATDKLTHFRHSETVYTREPCYIDDTKVRAERSGIVDSGYKTPSDALPRRYLGQSELVENDVAEELNGEAERKQGAKYLNMKCSNY
ncbi:hypothetical protein FOZ63_027195 [Perkinsus olseni]|uniref:Uncharacterized protein n=1 Tax=Perkinsus olseni TaxID=32597 RepID=A0A7J6QA44_PEROL|nr:hypothetical protein FOZ62_025567 [Perkinsus olseni]KAF4746726.1 hypothetical protein FOZ63_027195 [Perkinsus olseni]